MHNIFAQIEAACNGNDDGKKQVSSSVVAIIVAAITALSSSGFVFGWFSGLFNRPDLRPDDPAQITHFITGKTRERLVDLSGEWRFATGDGMERAHVDFDDSSWRSMTAPKYWTNKLGKYDGFAWYRRVFSLESINPSAPVFAILGQIDDVDEVFINGRKIGGQGSFPPKAITAWNRNRVYRIPEGVLKAGGENVIAVRVFDQRQGGGIARGALGIYTTSLPQPLIDLSGSWKFATGDDPDRKEPGYDDSGFNRIHVPIAWDLEGYRQHDGYAWYRKSFGDLSVPSGEEMVLVLGRIDDTDAVYLNGELIGQTGRLDYTDLETNEDYYLENRAYAFPSSLLGASNTLAVRVHDSGGHGGIYSGPVGVMTKEGYDAYRERLKDSRKWRLGETIDWLLGRD